MDHQNIEPIVLILVGSLENDRFAIKCLVQSLIFHMPEAVNCYFGLAFFEQQRLNFDALNICHLPKVVHVVVRGHLI